MTNSKTKLRLFVIRNKSPDLLTIGEIREIEEALDEYITAKIEEMISQEALLTAHTKQFKYNYPVLPREI